MSTNDTLRGLKPCPFCGETLAVSKSKLAAHPRFSECLLAQNVVDMDNPRQVDKWNARIEAALAEPVSGGATDERAQFNAEYDKVANRSITHREMAWRMWRARAALNGGAVAGHSTDAFGRPVELDAAGIPARMEYDQHPDRKYVDGWNDCLSHCRQGRDACTCKGGE